MNDNIGNLLIVSIGLVAWQAGCRFFSLKPFSVSALRLWNASVPFRLTPLSPFNQHLLMNALEAGLRGKCSSRPESDFVSVLRGSAQ